MAPDLDIHQPAGNTICSPAIGVLQKADYGSAAAPHACTLRPRFTVGG